MIKGFVFLWRTVCRSSVTCLVSFFVFQKTLNSRNIILDTGDPAVRLKTTRLTCRPAISIFQDRNGLQRRFLFQQ